MNNTVSTKRFCETQLIPTIEDLAKVMDDSGQTNALLLDFFKAFDKVSHSRLLSKLEHYGIGHSMLDWIQQFLSNCTQHVLLDSQYSSRAPVTSGIPQGTVLGSLLFLVYINGLSNRVSSKVLVMSASAKSRMVYPSGANSPGWSWTKGRKTVVIVVVPVP